jgi:hypothetical protein
MLSVQTLGMIGGFNVLGSLIFGRTRPALEKAGGLAHRRRAGPGRQHHPGRVGADPAERRAGRKRDNDR